MLSPGEELVAPLMRPYTRHAPTTSPDPEAQPVGKEEKPCGEEYDKIVARATSTMSAQNARRPEYDITRAR